MSKWSMEMFPEERVVFRGKVPILTLQYLIREYCEYDWVIDMQSAKELDATLVVCNPDVAKEWKKDAANQ